MRTAARTAQDVDGTLDALARRVPPPTGDPLADLDALSAAIGDRFPQGEHVAAALIVTVARRAGHRVRVYRGDTVAVVAAPGIPHGWVLSPRYQGRLVQAADLGETLRRG